MVPSGPFFTWSPEEWSGRVLERPSKLGSATSTNKLGTQSGPSCRTLLNQLASRKVRAIGTKSIGAALPREIHNTQDNESDESSETLARRCPLRWVRHRVVADCLVEGENAQLPVIGRVSHTAARAAIPLGREAALWLLSGLLEHRAL
jgi:hypothetical protein